MRQQIVCKFITVWTVRFQARFHLSLKTTLEITQQK